MKKSFLLLIYLALLVIPTVCATYPTIVNATGTDGLTLTFTLVDTVQETVNPGIGDNVTYRTVFNVTNSGVPETFNVTSFIFYFPDNRSSSNVLDTTAQNGIGTGVQNTTTFFSGTWNGSTGNYSMALFNNTGAVTYLNNTNNGTYLNITWVMLNPITQSKLSTGRAGRVYTETWNITSLASNLTIVNASLNMTPSYWYTRIGTPTGITFNGTTKNYLATLSDMTVYTDLNLTSNLLPFGSGWSTLSLAYNGPTVDLSSGSSSTSEGVIPEETKRKISFWMLIGIGIALIVGGAAFLVYFLKKPN